VHRFNSTTEAFLWLTERNLATLEELQMLKSFSKTRIARQQEICDTAMAHVRMFGERSWVASFAKDSGCIRVHDLLKGI
jgi:hypothetical protein